MSTPSSTAAGPTPAPVVDAGPFKFLDYYADTPEDHARFGGREREVREIVARITNQATLVLYGRSGIGKTSLLLAGVFPELRLRGYRPVYVRTLTSPLLDVGRAVARECGLSGGGPSGAQPITPEPEPAAERGTPAANLRDTVALATGAGPLAIVLDQFEEFFIRFRDQPALREEFLAGIAGIINDEALDATVVFSLREDYLAQLDDFRPALPSLFENAFRLVALTAFGVRQAILRPLVRAGVAYEDAVVSKLVDQLEGFHYDPPLLQIICSELYREAVRRAAGAVPSITLEDLKNVGGLEGIFRRYLDGVTQAVPKERHLLARMVLDALITRDSTKQAATLRHLLNAAFSATAEEVGEILDALTAQRLLRREEREGEAWYELIHERLVPNVREWLDLDRQFFEFRQARTFVRNNSEGDLWRTNPDALLNAGVLSGLLGQFQERFRFNDRELEFVVRSAIHRGSDSARFWAERFGLERAVSMVEELAAESDSGSRRAAAAAAAKFPELGDRVAPLCLRLAVADPDEPVRAAAGLSLAALARPEDLTSLRAALVDRGTRTRAREVLTNLNRGGHQLQGFDWRSRQLARRRARKGLLLERRDTIRARRKIGGVSGLVAGLAWTVAVGVPLAVLSSTVLKPALRFGQWFTDVAITIAFLGISAAWIGAVVGWLAGAAVAREAAASGHEGRWRVVSWRGLWRGALGLTLVGVVSLPFLELLACLAYVAMFGVVPLVLPALLLPVGGALARLIRPGVWPGVFGREYLLWTVVSVAGLPVLLPLLAVSLVAWGWPGVPAGQLAWAAAAACSLATAAVTTAIAESCSRQPMGELPIVSPERRWRFRALAVGAVLLVPAWFVWGYDRDATPVSAPVRDFDPIRGVEHERAGRAPLQEISYFQIRNREDDLRIVRVAEVQVTAPGALRVGAAEDPKPGQLMFLAPGMHLASVTTKGPRGEALRQYLKLEPVELQAAPAGGPFHLLPDVTSVLQLPLSEDGPRAWKASLVGVLDTAPGSQPRRILLRTAWVDANQGLPGTIRIVARGPAGVLPPYADSSSETTTFMESGETGWTGPQPDETGRVLVTLDQPGLDLFTRHEVYWYLRPHPQTGHFAIELSAAVPASSPDLLDRRASPPKLFVWLIVQSSAPEVAPEPIVDESPEAVAPQPAPEAPPAADAT